MFHVPGTFHGFGSWFAVTFGDLPNPKSDPVVLSTSPFDKYKLLSYEYFCTNFSCQTVKLDPRPIIKRLSISFKKINLCLEKSAL